jgi:hypothetical protein
MSFSAYVKQERELFRIHTEEREIMRAPEMLR